ncbi:MAG: ORF6N domain-containing protein [Elusimicrobia bacterium]|nr:ORF6N domain-containing protein [Elusimicrobiota bacterium]
MVRMIPAEKIEKGIFIIRGVKVMLDRDLAGLYGVTTMALNQAVKRNLRRFPRDFMFRLTEGERDEVITICDNLKPMRFSSSLPYAFTENGVAMLSSVLRSPRSIRVNIQIMRTFTRLRRLYSLRGELARGLGELENRIRTHDAAIENIFQAIRQLMAPEEEPRKQIGFRPD